MRQPPILRGNEMDSVKIKGVRHELRLRADGATVLVPVAKLPRKNKLSSLCEHRRTRQRLADLIGEKL